MSPELVPFVRLVAVLGVTVSAIAFACQVYNGTDRLTRLIASVVCLGASLTGGVKIVAALLPAAGGVP